MEEALVHSGLNRDLLEELRSRYAAVFGPDAIAPTPVGSFQASYNNNRYVILGSPKRVLAVYRVRRDTGSLCLLGNWASALNRLHRQRVVHYHNPPAWPDQRRRSGGIYGA